MKKSKKYKILCPYCKHPTSIMADSKAKCKGVYVRCKGAHCKKVFEIVINGEIK